MSICEFVKKLFRVIFIERRPPSKCYRLLEKIGIRIKEKIIITDDGLVLKTNVPNPGWLLQDVRGYDIPGFVAKDGMNILDIGAHQVDNENRELSLLASLSQADREESKLGNFKSLEVQATGINDYMDACGVVSWDFVKIDTEGWELKILSALTRDNFNKIQRMSIELHAGYDDKELLRFLKEAGFSIVYFKEVKGSNTGFIKAVRA